MHNDELKKFSQNHNQLSLSDLKYKILMGFNYVEGDDCNTSFNQDGFEFKFDDFERGYHSHR